MIADFLTQLRLLCRELRQRGELRERAIHPEDLRQILGYQYRIGRGGEDPTGYVVGARVVRVVEGEYVRPGVDPASCLRYTLEEKPQYAIYPVPRP